MGSWLLKLGIAGVQPFIAQARRTRDLAAGSRLISCLAFAAASCARERGGEQVLPDVATPQHSFPNQVLLRWHDQAPEEIRSHASEMVAAARTELCSIVDQLISIDDPDLESPLLQHVQEAAELCWVAVAIEGDGANAYEQACARLQQAFAARKRTRTYQQLAMLPAGLPVWTCQVCGERPGVVGPMVASIQQHLRLNDRHSVSRIGDDRLCIVCAARRLWAYGSAALERAPSTLRLSLGRLAQQSKQDRRLKEQLDAAGDALGPVLDSTREAVAAALDDRRKAQYRHLLDHSYYALVIADGDQMGRWMSGEHRKASEPLESHQARLSRAMVHAASSLDTWVRAAGRSVFPVYMGGDDALLLCCLDDLFPLIRQLHRGWNDALSNESFPPEWRPTLTLHASVVHSKEPLQGVLTQARQQLSQTKEALGRDCLSLLGKVHAGGEVLLQLQWHELPQLVAAVEALSSWRLAESDVAESELASKSQLPAADEIERREAAALPGRLPFSLLETTSSMFTAGQTVFDALALGRELERVAQRGDGGKQDTEQGSTWPALKTWLVEQRATYPPRGRRVGSECPRPQEAFRSALRLVAFLARQLTWKGVA